MQNLQNSPLALLPSCPLTSPSLPLPSHPLTLLCFLPSPTISSFLPSRPHTHTPSLSYSLCNHSFIFSFLPHSQSSFSLYYYYFPSLFLHHLPPISLTLPPSPSSSPSSLSYSPASHFSFPCLFIPSPIDLSPLSSLDYNLLTSSLHPHHHITTRLSLSPPHHHHKPLPPSLTTTLLPLPPSLNHTKNYSFIPCTSYLPLP